ncbi:MAG TPA: glycosyltransferase family 9 protein [Chthoniobacteraceae bacterium]|nr:glycosyltransferase family 9 protein [Chthoniobacteraceae bacterium]
MGLRRATFEIATRCVGIFAPRAGEPVAEPRSIFVLRNNDIGDLLVVTPLFEALKRRFPRAKIVAGIGSWNLDVLKHNPYVDEVVLNAPWHNGKVRPQGLIAGLRYIYTSSEARDLAAQRCEIGIDVLGSGYGALLMMRCGMPFRLGVRGYGGGHSTAQRCVVYNEREHVGRAALRFAELLGATELPENRPQLFAWPKPEINGVIVMAPGGGHPGNCWPLENYVELARALTPRKIVVIGGEKDREAAAKIAEGRVNVDVVAGALPLAETFRLIAGCAMVITNSSMAMHAAAAFRKPCFALLGAGVRSASAHAAQWAYPETRVLGAERGVRGVWSPAEVFETISAS